MIRFIQNARNADSAGVADATTLVVGGGQAGLGLATELAREAHAVAFVDDGAPEDVDGVEVFSHGISDANALRDVVEAVGDVGAVVAVGPDSEALLVAHLARLELTDATVVAFVDDQKRRCAFDGVEADAVSTPSVLADAIRDRLSQVTHA